MTDSSTAVSREEYERLRRATDDIHRSLTRYAADLYGEVRHLQGMLHRATDGELSCEDICRVVCAGPCEGRSFRD